MNFSSRVPFDLTRNRLSTVLERLHATREALIDLTESNPTRVGLDYPLDLLRPLADPQGLVYRPDPLGLASARSVVASEFARRGLSVAPERIVLTSSTSEAYSLLFKLLCNAGDEVLVSHPSYPLFDHLTRLDSVVSIPYALEYHGRWSIDVDDIARRVSPKTRAILIVNPNNPTGSFATTREIEHLGSLCRARGIALVGDEVFADYRLSPEAEATSVLHQEEALTFSLGGLSKSAGLPQVKLGWIGVGGPAGEVEQALDRLEVVADAYLSVGTPVQEAAASLVQAGANVRRQIQDRLTANLEALKGIVAMDPSCRLLHAEAGWCAVIQVPATESEESLVLDLLERDRVLVHPGYFFDFVTEAFVIVSLLPRPDEFGRGIRQLMRRVQEPA